jgi:mannosyl-3-phosphoglycerate phosphatase
MPLHPIDYTMACIIFTDLDGTLLNAESYSYQAALPTLARLKQAGIPVIPVTSKTRKEVEQLRADVGLQEPFVVENGSAVFMPTDQTTFRLPDGEDMDGYRVLQLGCNYVTARAALKAIAVTIGRPLKGFGDWTVDQIVQLTGLPPEDARQAKAREFTEPFMTPKNVTPEALRDAVEDMGFKVVIGDRFSHLIGGEAGKGIAVHQLVELYRASHDPDAPVVTVGLGNSPNDLDMLENVDHAIVLPGETGPHPRLANRGWTVAPAPAPEGWALAVEDILNQLQIQL